MRPYARALRIRPMHVVHEGRDHLAASLADRAKRAGCTWFIRSKPVRPPTRELGINGMIREVGCAERGWRREAARRHVAVGANGGESVAGLATENAEAREGLRLLAKLGIA